jgi:polyribonucleotide nucleotidyltransferase
MDIKISGLTQEILAQALEQAKRARFFLLDKMDAVTNAPKIGISDYAPKIVSLTIPQGKIGELIGPGGKNIRKIQEDNEVEIDIEESGKVFISGKNSTGVAAAKATVEAITAEVEVGKIYQGKITRLMAFGAFAEVLPGKEGLIHISQLSEKRVAKVEDVVKEGDIVTVKAVEIDEKGRLNLSVKAAMK